MTLFVESIQGEWEFNDYKGLLVQ